MLSKILIATAATAALAACGAKPPGAPNVPSKPDVPGGDKVPGGVPGAGPSDVDPNACGGYAAGEAGARLKAFITATKELQTASAEMAGTIKSDCVAMGKELGMPEGDLGGNDTGAVCNKVFEAYKANLKVAFKAGAKLKVAYTPAKCTVEANASASAGAACSGAAAADNSGGGAAAQCKAAGSVNAAVHASCTPAKLTVEADAKLIVDKSKAEMTLKAARNGFPKILDAAAKAEVLKDATVTWAKTAVDLKEVAPKLAEAFKGQAMCVTTELGVLAASVPSIQANVSVSVSVSASASGSVGG